VVTTSAVGGVINWTREPGDVATMRFPDFSKVRRDRGLHSISARFDL
jgi:hypothetical protein